MNVPFSEGLEDPRTREATGERAAAVVGLALAALSGFLMGLLVHGAFAAVIVLAFLVPMLGFAGWWLRGVLAAETPTQDVASHAPASHRPPLPTPQISYAPLEASGFGRPPHWGAATIRLSQRR